MVTMDIDFYSSELTECNSLKIVTPSEGNKYPVLWLLPPLGCNQTRWCAHTDIEALARKKNLMVVMPDMKLSCGLDMVHGFKFHSMLVKELPHFLKTHFSVDLDHQFMAGAEEGAYAAVYAALENPGMYEKVIALSGGSLVEEGKLIDGDSRFFNAFGKKPSQLKGSRYDIEMRIMELLDASEVVVAYGKLDKYYKSAKRLGSLAASNGDGKLDVFTGFLDWNTWYTILEKRI